MSKKIVYIAGKMRGITYYNFPEFDAARDRLTALGFEVLSPADMDRKAGLDPRDPEWLKYVAPRTQRSDGQNPVDWTDIPKNFDLAAAIERDNTAIDKAHAVYVIHEGISGSVGGMKEIERGMNAGKAILFDTMSDERILRAMGVDSVPASDGVFGKQKTDARYTEREGVLDEAKKLITGDRNCSYGPPTQDFQRTADMTTALFSAKLKDGRRFKASDVAWIITLVKASRAQHSAKRDNYVDAAGYMGCGWECEANEPENAKYAKGESK